ncbi:MAG: hypothetical protein B6D61_06915 [Bacteroidetes bacterium 4484_249]|nr:MAG: hypothetical protein B6D61_06915 [Bacteroidetes bacterium 4484_249]
MAKKKPIIVTGAHRSGTTWVGQMIALDKNIRYIHEPFNIDEPRIHPLKYWFEYVCDDDTKEKQNKVYKYIDEILDFNPGGVIKDMKMIKGPRDVLKFSKDTIERINKRPLLKDPIMVMSTDWVAKKFDADVVALIRHPAAFVASLKVKKWTHVFDHFIEQEKLMKILEPFAKQINEYAASPPDIIEQGILLWNITYFRINQYRENYPDWIYVRHEDLSMEPVNEFKKIYDKLNLNFTTTVEKKIIESTSAGKAEHLKRDSKKNIFTWKKRLTEQEIERIKTGTQEISSIFYSEKDW